MPWTAADIPDLTGKVAVVTGANTGLGFEDAKQLAKRGARVILACRNEGKGTAAVARIIEENPSGRAETMRLDLGDLESVKEFAGAYRSKSDRLDILINNAGVMIPPYGKTKDGFELQIGVNHLGHFALTGHLLDTLIATPGARVVTLSSQAHRRGRIDFDDLQWERRRYNHIHAYSQSKLANLLFHFEFTRRLEKAGHAVTAAAAHPGWTQTDLQRHSKVAMFFNPFFSMAPQQGALPTLRAATDPDVNPGDYFGPKGFHELKGEPVRVGTSKAAKNAGDQRRLWEVSEELTGVRYLPV